MNRHIVVLAALVALAVALSVLLALFPELKGIRILLENLLIYITIYGIYVLSLNLEVGYLGIPQFGKVMFLTIGAIAVGGIATKLMLLIYQSAVASSIGVSPLSNIHNYCTLYQYSVISIVNQQLALNPVLGLGYLLFGIILAMILSAVLGLLFAYPAIRLREDYLGILLLVSAEFIRIVTYYATPVACGVNGAVIPDPFAWAVGEERTLVFLAASALFLVVAFLVFQRLGNSPFGRALRAIRDAETAASVFGKDIVKFRIRVLAVSSAFGGLAGALLAYYFDYTILGTFLPIYTFIGWTMLILGGMGNNVGALVGVALYYGVSTLLDIYKNSLQALLFGADPTYLEYVVFGLAIILVLMYRPQGIVPEKPVKTVDLERIRKSTKS